MTDQLEKYIEYKRQNLLKCISKILIIVWFYFAFVSKIMLQLIKINEKISSTFIYMMFLYKATDDMKNIGEC